MGRLLALIYGVVSYAFFFGVFLYAIGFTGNMIVPRSIDAGGTAGVGIMAVVINLALLSVFALQHSIMARPEFKAVWTKIIPKSIERSTYVLLASAALALIFWQWRPHDGPRMGPQWFGWRHSTHVDVLVRLALCPGFNLPV